MPKDSRTVELVKSSGDVEGTFPISVGPRFLELFSENLYSSPNKAFEELVANSWDADATSVYIHISEDLNAADAVVWVLDNGTSMDFDGLRLLWTITSAHKRVAKNTQRPQIGKFGIGKLSTYILASEITYICKGGDGIIRAIPLNYGQIDEIKGVWEPDKVPLSVHNLSESELSNVLSTVGSGQELLKLIESGVPEPPEAPSYEDEFGSPHPKAVSPTGTWTLVLLTSLKSIGRSLQTGRIRRMLRAALPLSNQVGIVLNDETLEPSKLDAAVEKRWIIGRDLQIDEIELTEDDVVKINEYPEADPPYSVIDGIEGKIYGRVTLYQSRITGGKSEALGSSNGFFINVLGRVINLENPDFGLENLSHSAWAQFRATVRVDGLDTYLGVEREGLRDSRPVLVFRAFLRALFNKARTALAASESAAWPSAGDVLDGSWKTIPLRSLAQVVGDCLEAGGGLPGSIDASNVEDLERVKEEWNEIIRRNPGDLISSVESRDLGVQLPLFRYDLETRTVLVNESHPYYQEHKGTIEERRVLQDVALADFLTEIHLISNGVDAVALDEGRSFRDEFLRLLARLERRTGPQIAQLLLDATTHADGFEVIVGDCLEYIGFLVERKGERGEPEGIARAPLTPGAQPTTSSYSFTYDAKSKQRLGEKVSNKDVGAGRLARHRKKYSANHTLVVAPDFELGALQDECAASKVTPIRARDLATLLMVSAASGTADFANLRKLFDFRDPDDVSAWVGEYAKTAQATPHLSIGELLETFIAIGFEGPDILETSVIADRIRQKRDGDSFPSELAVRRVVEGLGVLLPTIVRSSGKEVYLSAAPSAIRAALLEQLQRLPEELRMGIDKGIVQEQR